MKQGETCGKQGIADGIPLVRRLRGGAGYQQIGTIGRFRITDIYVIGSGGHFPVDKPWIVAWLVLHCTIIIFFIRSHNMG